MQSTLYASFMSLNIRVKNPVKFSIFEIYFGCIKFREFDHAGHFAGQNSQKFVLAKISTLKVFLVSQRYT